MIAKLDKSLHVSKARRCHAAPKSQKLGRLEYFQAPYVHCHDRGTNCHFPITLNAIAATDRHYQQRGVAVVKNRTAYIAEISQPLIIGLHTEPFQTEIKIGKSISEKKEEDEFPMRKKGNTL
jgi:hypothetical protein